MLRLSLISLALFCSTSQAVNLEFGAGQCKAKGHGEGQWWQDVGGEMVSADLRSKCYQIGASNLAGSFKGIGLGWRAAWVDFGRIDLDEKAFGGVGPQPHWTASGSGSVRGVSLGGIAQKTIGNFSLGAEGGIYAYRSAWETTASHVSHGGYSQEANPASNYAANLYYGVGAGYNYKSLSIEIRARYYPRIDFNQTADNLENVGPSNAAFRSVMLGAAWSFK